LGVLRQTAGGMHSVKVRGLGVKLCDLWSCHDTFPSLRNTFDVFVCVVVFILCVRSAKVYELGRRILFVQYLDYMSKQLISHRTDMK